MTQLFFTVFIAALIFFFLREVFERAFKKKYKASFNKKYYFFSIAEKEFYNVLKEVAKELNYELFAKVRWADVIFPGGKGKEWWYNWGKIKSKHIDFLLCEKENYRPIIAIELDDSSHSKDKTIKRDIFQAEVLESVGLKLVRFNVQSNYSKEDIKDKLSNII